MNILLCVTSFSASENLAAVRTTLESETCDQQETKLSLLVTRTQVNRGNGEERERVRPLVELRSSIKYVRVLSEKKREFVSCVKVCTQH